MNHREILQALLDGKTLITASGCDTIALIKDCLIYNLGTDKQANVHSFYVDRPSLWKIKPKTININGFEVPEPVRKLEDRQVYHWVNVSAGKTQTTYYADFEEDNKRLANGVVHLTKEAAQTHLDALLSFTKLEGKDE